MQGNITIASSGNWAQMVNAESAGILSLNGNVTVNSGVTVENLYRASGGFVFVGGSTVKNGTVTTTYKTEKGGRIYYSTQTSSPNY